MIHEYKLKGLDCANCANKIQNAVGELNSVLSSTVNFINTSLTVETSENYKGDITADIKKIVRKYEPDVIVIEKISGEYKDERNHGHVHTQNNKLKQNRCSGDEEEQALSPPGFDKQNRCSGDEEEQALSPPGFDNTFRIARLALGATLFGIGMILEHLFIVNPYIVSILFILGYVILGGKVVLKALKNVLRGRIIDENFLMSVATIGAFIIGEIPEAVAVMLFYQIGELFEDLAVHRSRKSISALMDIRPDFANLITMGEIKKVSPETVRIGDIILVKPGEKIPLDGIVTDGESMLDTTALTGESVPRKISVSDMALSGCINQTGVLTVEVTKTFGESTASKIIDLVENAAAKKAPTENFITTFSKYYTPAVVGLALLISVLPPLFFGGSWAEWVNRGLIFLVISCPCALVISIPLGFFGGIGAASKSGILVKGGNYLEALSKLDIVVFDKTGTLTKGVFKVTGIFPASGFDDNLLLEIAAKAEVFSNHPIAISIGKAYGKEIDKSIISKYNEIPGCGISAFSEDKVILAGNAALMSSSGIVFQNPEGIGTKVYIAVDSVFAGCIVISDEIKTDSREAITRLKSRGVRKIVMLTGDTPEIAEETAKELNLDDVYAGLLPAGKIEITEKHSVTKRGNGKLAFVGDGINDAPVLARADIGIAMGCLGSDAAIEAADIVLMTDEPSKLAEAVDIARATKRIVWQNIIFALTVKAIILLLGSFGMATMWGAVFADVGVSFLAIMNSLRLIPAGNKRLQ